MCTNSIFKGILMVKIMSIIKTSICPFTKKAHFFLFSSFSLKMNMLELLQELAPIQVTACSNTGGKVAV